MNSDAMDTDMSCQSCKKKPATTAYTNRKGTVGELVCASCLDLLQLQEEFGLGIYDRQELDEQERYDEILAWVDEFEQVNRHRDLTGWLARAAAAHRACVYWQAERYDESLEAAEIRIQLGGLQDAWDHWAAASAKANALQGLGRHAEALTTFEEAFRHQDPSYVDSARSFMTSLVEFSENAGKPVDESWRHVVENVAHEYDVEFPVRPTLAESILALFEMTENMPSKRQRNPADAQEK